MSYLGDTLFSDQTCPLQPVKFLWWKWEERKHDLKKICRWSEPGHYSTIFCTKYVCLKCWGIYVDRNEQSGP